jgi:Cu/Ag efflux pump CusA
VRGTLAPSTGPSEGIRLANQARILLCSFPEVTECTSQVGRPDDGTDTTGFFNTEYFVGLKPKEEWRPAFDQDKERLIAAMNSELEKIPGVIWNFSQPIADNMEEAVSGVKGQLATKVYGDDLKILEDTADRIVKIMRGVRGIQDLGVFRELGQPNLNVTVDRRQAARYQINVADVQDAIQTAVGGNALTQVLQGEARYDLVMRYLPQYRDTKEAVQTIRLLSPTGERVSLAQLCQIDQRDGASEIYREGNQRYISRLSTACANATWAARLVREREARRRALAGHSPAHHPADLYHSVHHVPLLQMGDSDSGEYDARAHRRLARCADHAHELQRLLGRRFPGAIRRVGPNRSDHARIHKSAARAGRLD